VPPFLTLALYGRERSALRPYRFTPGEKAPGTYWLGGWVGPRASLNGVPLPRIEPQFLGRPARSPSLYRLRYRYINSEATGQL
jgi:hypothetical protein